MFLNRMEFFFMTEIILQGQKYASMAEAARKHHMPYAMLRYRIHKLGLNHPDLFKPKYARRGKSITINGVHYDSLIQAAKQHHMSCKSLRNKLQKYGPNSVRVENIKNHRIKINGTYFENINQVACANYISPATLAYHLKKYGSIDSIIINEPRTNRIKNLFYNKQTKRCEYHKIDNAKWQIKILYGDDLNFMITDHQQDLTNLHHYFVINGKFCANMQQAANILKISLSAFSRRLSRMDPNNTLKLFKMPGITIDGQHFMTKYEAAEHFNLSLHQFEYLLKKYGPDDATKFTVKNMPSWKRMHVVLNGKYLGTRKELMQKYGLSYEAVKTRILYHQKTGHGDITAKPRKRYASKEITVFGKKFKSIYAANKYFNLKHNYLGNISSNYGLDSSKWPSYIVDRVKQRIADSK